MPTSLEFCLLGPLTVKRDGAAVPVSPGKQRALLAALLLNANRAVPVDELAGDLWGASLPPSARASLQTYVMRLRKALGDDGPPRIVTQADGYLIRVGPGELDADRFAALLAAAREAARAGRHADAAARLHSALALWRGEPLAGVASETLSAREVPRLAEMRLQALEARIDADLHLGRHADVIAELRRLTAANPLRERLHAMMMLALSRNGQQADALAAYRAARGVLVDELGIEPGPELRLLHQQILSAGHAAPPAAGASLAAVAPPAGADLAGDPAPVPAAAVPVPRQLPGAVPHFAGRSAELAALTSALDEAARTGGTVVISAIAGTAGIGKTALAVHWAHQVTDRFPDGQLYLNLRGYGPSGTPMTPAEAVRHFLDGLGVPPERIPGGLDAQVALYRSRLAGQRMLILLDNAADAAQVRPVLPGSTGCMALVTSRDHLAGLAASDGAQLLVVDALGEEQARDMLAGRLGRDRVTAEPAAVTALTGLCAGLPLALGVAAARAVAHPGLSIAALAADLRDTGSRLDGLSTGDVATDVRTVFSWSLRHLTRPANEMFRLLGVHPGPDITVPAAASLAGVPPRQARDALAELTRAHLLTEHTPGRYACHDLLRVYAGELAARDYRDALRQAAVRRMLDHYLHTAYAAAHLIMTHRDEITIGPPLPQVHPEELADREQALSWFRDERAVLVGIIGLVPPTELSCHGWQLPWTAVSFFIWDGYWDELEATQRQALTVLRQLGKTAEMVSAHRLVALARARLGDFVGASTHLGKAMELAHQIGSHRAQAQVHDDVAEALDRLDRGQDAVGHAEQALRLYRTAGERDCEAHALNNLGWYHVRIGACPEALSYCEQALALSRELRERHTEAAALDTLGYAHHRMGQHAQAIGYYREALKAQGEDGDRLARAEMLTHLGDAHDAVGQPGAARDAWHFAMDILGPGNPASDKLRARLAAGPYGAAPPGSATGTVSRLV